MAQFIRSQGFNTVEVGRSLTSRNSLQVGLSSSEDKGTQPGGKFPSACKAVESRRVQNHHYSRISLMTLPYTSVSRMSRPLKR
jgi:hypothetical protein